VAGPFYFAWVGAHETTFNSVTHKREDESIFSFTVEHNEGDFATLHLEVRNPRIGLLAPARKIHCWLSWWNGHELKPLFHGRLVGIPDDINLEIVTLQFTGRADNHAGQKGALAQSMRVAPYYDPLWITQDKRNDPDTVLEARSELYVDVDYQYYDGNVVAIGTGDVGYSVPVDRPNDDGLVFPLTQVPYLQRPQFHPGIFSAEGFPITHSGNASTDAQQNKQAIENTLKKVKSTYSFSIRPVEGGSFASEYDITTTDLVIPQGIDLYAPSS
jgi:hypothetical protein